MTARIHPTAIVDPGATLGEGVEVGAYAMVGPGCRIGDGCVLAPRAILERNVTLGREVKVGSNSLLGGDPQDLKYHGEETFVEVGDGTLIREYVTINRGTTQSYRTVVGRHCYLMMYSHVGHDAHVGDHVILSNVVQLGGHSVIEDRAIISAMSAVHQFTRVGRHAFVGGFTRVTKDVPPFLKAVGSPMRLYGLNSVGLQRSGFDPELLRELKRAYRLMFRSDLNVSQALERARSDLPPLPEVQQFLQFIEDSQRGIGF